MAYQPATAGRGSYWSVERRKKSLGKQEKENTRLFLFPVSSFLMTISQRLFPNDSFLIFLKYYLYKK